MVCSECAQYKRKLVSDCNTVDYCSNSRNICEKHNCFASYLKYNTLFAQFSQPAHLRANVLLCALNYMHTNVYKLNDSKTMAA
jgi:hypothetical protein